MSTPRPDEASHGDDRPDRLPDDDTLVRSGAPDSPRLPTADPAALDPGTSGRAGLPTPAAAPPPSETLNRSGAPSPSSLPPSAWVAPQLPGYEILGELGRGGMGVVYMARQVPLNRVVALKMILAGGHAGPDAVARFLREAAAVAALHHPHIVQLFDYGEQDGLPYFTVEFAPGGSLARKLSGTPLPPREAARLLEQLARGVHHAHERGVIHRDLKPANVLLTENGWPKVADFGLAKRADAGEGLTASTAVMGTPSYMAPEQARGVSKQVGPAVDVYALGAILYECLTGAPPFRGKTPAETLLQVIHNEPVPVRRLQPGVPADLETVCLKCLHKEPHRRYASAAELAEDLRRFLAGQAIKARPESLWERGVRWMRRRPAAAVLTAISLVIYVPALLFLLMASLDPTDTPSRDEAAPKRSKEIPAPKHQVGEGAEAIHNVQPGGEIVLGMSAAFQGPARGLGIELYRGSMAYFEHVNRSGGVHGRKIVLKAYDDGYDPGPAVKNTIRVIEEDKALLLFGYVGTPTVTRVLPLLKLHSNRDVYLFFPFTGASPHRTPPYDQFVFNLRASYHQETRETVEHFFLIGRKRIAVFYEMDSLGREGWDGVRTALARHALAIVAEAMYRRGTPFAANLRRQVEILRKADPDAVICVGAYAACAAFVRDARDAGWGVPITNVSFVGSENLLALLLDLGKSKGKDYTRNLINSQVVPSPYDPSLPAVKLYRELMDRYRPMPPSDLVTEPYRPLPHSYLSLEGFLNAKLLVEILKGVGKDMDRKRLRPTVEGFGRVELGIDVPVSFSATRHQGLDRVYFTEVKDGRFVPVEDWKPWSR